MRARARRKQFDPFEPSSTLHELVFSPDLPYAPLAPGINRQVARLCVTASEYAFGYLIDSGRFLLMAISVETKQQWDTWVATNVRKPFRKEARKAVEKALGSATSAEEVAAAAKRAEAARANYMALSALVLGAMSAAIALFVGGVSILATLFALASFAQGRHAGDNAWQAWAGLALAALGIVLFVVRLTIG